MNNIHDILFSSFSYYYPSLTDLGFSFIWLLSLSLFFDKENILQIDMLIMMMCSVTGISVTAKILSRLMLFDYTIFKYVISKIVLICILIQRPAVPACFL